MAYMFVSLRYKQCVYICICEWNEQMGTTVFGKCFLFVSDYLILKLPTTKL